MSDRSGLMRLIMDLNEKQRSAFCGKVVELTGWDRTKDDVFKLITVDGATLLAAYLATPEVE